MAGFVQEMLDTTMKMGTSLLLTESKSLSSTKGIRYIEDNTWARGDMEFLFERSTRYLTCECSERERYRVEHEKRNSISPRNHALLCF